MRFRAVPGTLSAVFAAAVASAQPRPSGPVPPPPGAGTPAQPAKPETPPPAEATQKSKRLMVGDKAPPLSVGAWVKGAAVPGFEAGKVYIVEFWATWCVPCKASVPHLSEIQAKFRDKGVTVIGVASPAMNDALDSDGDSRDVSVRHFVGMQGDKMAYTVAWDDKGTMVREWFEASQQEGIPAAFVVNQEGVIAWIGNPMFPEKEMDSVLARVVENTFDMGAAVARAKRDAAIKEQADKVLGEANDLWKAGKQREAAEKLDEVVALDPEKYGDLAIQKFGVLIVSLKDADAGYAYANRLIDGVFKNNAAMLNALAWTILSDDRIEKRDAPVARRAALRANELKAGKDPGILDTLAAAYFESGDAAKAAETEGRAVAQALDPELKAELAEKLAGYQRAAAEKNPEKAPEKAPKNK